MNIILLGQSGFPYGMATIQKMKLIAEGLVHQGDKVTFINRLPVFPSREPYTLLSPSGNIGGVDYVYTSGSLIRPDGFIRRNVQRVMSFYSELRYLVALNRKRKTEVAIVYETKMLYLIWYYILSRAMGFRIFLHYVEFRSKIPGKPFMERINHLLFDRYAFRFLDGVLPISEVLEKYAKSRNTRLPGFKLPTIVDFSLFDRVEKGNEGYFLFCGSADYTSIIQFILNCFDRIEHPGFRLKIITNGSSAGLYHVKSAVAHSSKSEKIDVLVNIPYEDLISNYCNASALLIPLRHTVQDEARFPHKIGEYTAAAKPIITTNSGEIKYYFRHGENALIADVMEENSYSALMQFIASHPEQAQAIGYQGYETGRNHFDHITVTKALHCFFSEINSRSQS